MKVFISYNRKDTKYRKKLENILNHYKIDYFVVPLNENFNGKSHEYISQYLNSKMKDCDVFICLIGLETYSRPHVDREIHTALKGDLNNRKGIISVLLPTRNDNYNNLDLNTFPIKLFNNMNYIIKVKWSDVNGGINNFINQSLENARNKRIKISNKNQCLKLRNSKYYDN